MLKAVLIAVSVMSASAFADEYFHTPSGNIYCQGANDGVTCYIMDKTNTAIVSRPNDCDLDWGNLFYLEAPRGRAELVCHGDALDLADTKKLAYGKTIKGKGWQCTSQKTGLTCKNSQGHGFTLSRKKQTLF